MRDRNDLDPFLLTLPSASALDFAEQIAGLSGLDFDREAVADQSLSLYESMFQELATILKLPDGAIAFRSGHYFSARTFAAKNAEGGHQVSLDDTFDFWLFALSHLGVIAMCESLSEKDLKKIGERVHDAFLMFEDAARFQTMRETLKPYIADYAHLLNLSHGLARAMLVFTVCHEIAHCRLRHLDVLASKEGELEADAIGTMLFSKVIEFGHGDTDTSVHVDPKVAGAPLALLGVLYLHERWLERSWSNATPSLEHPTAKERLATVEPILTPYLDEAARYICDGFNAALGDIEGVLFGGRS